MKPNKCIVFETKPENFIPTVEVSGCYCEHNGKFLLLKRHPEKPQGNSWGMPAGKLEKGEDPKQGVLREVLEETGLELNNDQVKSLGHLYVKHPELDFIFHVFYNKFDHLPTVLLGLEEHLECRWITVQEAYELPLIGGGHEVISYAIRKINELDA